MVATSGKPRPLIPDLGVFLVPHLEEPRLCSYPLGFMVMGREGGRLRLDWSAAPSSSLSL